MTMEKIAARQNEAWPLRMQFAARMLYNKAEKKNYAIWVLCIISTIMGFIASILPAWLASVVILLVDSLAFVFGIQMEKNIRQAAGLRGMFDRFVFGMPLDTAEDNTAELREVAVNLSEKYPREYEHQTTHDGSDVPPGVKDWYNTKIAVKEGFPPAFFLIKENKWWDKQMNRYKYILCLVVFIIIATLMLVCMKSLTLADIIIFVSGILGLLIRLIERIVVAIKSHDGGVEINKLIDVFANFDPNEGLKILQSEIDSYRSLPVVHCSFFHTKFAKKLHKKYSAIHVEGLE